MLLPHFIIISWVRRSTHNQAGGGQWICVTSEPLMSRIPDLQNHQPLTKCKGNATGRSEQHPVSNMILFIRLFVNLSKKLHNNL